MINLKKGTVSLLVILISLIMINAQNFGYQNPSLPKLVPPTNNSGGSNQTIIYNNITYNNITNIYENNSANNSQFLRGYTPFNLPYVAFEIDPVFTSWLSTFFFNYNQTQPAIDYTNNYSYPLSNPNGYINQSQLDNGTFVPYNNATANVNLGDKNLSSANLFIPTNGTLNFRSDYGILNDTYLVYNGLTHRVELWANSKLQQDWGNSTTIYGVATFESNAFFTNLSGDSLLISANVDINGSLLVEQNGTFQNVYANNICYSNGTNCNSNQTSNTTSNNAFNQTGSNYLYGINNTIYFNDSLNNQTITQIANVNAFQQVVNVNVVSGIGFNISTPINYYLTELIVIAPTNITTFNFQATQNNVSGYMIDKDRVQHTGTWDIYKQYSLSNDTIFLNITNASIDGLYSITIKYINSKFTYP